LGEKKAGRAVGSACRMNPLLLVVPCHRVIGSDKKLTGFNIGIDKKSYLLNHEEAKGDNEKTLF
jgi:methylated-DNA-[protein]-cysteine S-methyltransferase